MLNKYTMYLVNILVEAIERAIGWVVGLMDSLILTCGRKILVEIVLQTLGWIDRLLVSGKRYLEGVRRTLRYRLYFEAVTRPMSARYRELKRH
jgi:hypothetical protein